MLRPTIWRVVRPGLNHSGKDQQVFSTIGSSRVEARELENSALRRKLGADSTNSSAPSSRDSLAVRAGRDGVLRAYCQRRGDLAEFGGERAGGADRDG